MTAGGVVATGGNSSGQASGGITAAGGDASAGATTKSAAGAPIGYAALPGNNLQTTTGGGALVPDVAASCADLQTYLATDDSPRVVVVNNTTIDCTIQPPIQVTTCVLACDPTTGDTKNYYRVLSGADCSSSGGTATTPTALKTQNAATIFVKSNKTLLGTGPSSTISGATLYLQSTVSNVIIQNLNLQNVNPDLVEAGDAITIDGANHVWVDHCNFSLISDGFVDVVSPDNGTTVPTDVTLSWNHFDGNNQAACGGQHNYANTVEYGTVTFHHNFYDHTLGCSPKITYPSAKVHLFNNCWLDVLYYSVGVDKGAEALVESNDFNNSSRPYWMENSCLDKNSCAISDNSSSNQFEGTSAGATQNKDTGGTLLNLPPYQLTASQVDAVTAVAGEVVQNSGPTLSP